MKYFLILVFLFLLNCKDNKEIDCVFDDEKQFYITDAYVVQKDSLVFLKFNRAKVNTVIASVNNNEGKEVCESWHEIECISSKVSVIKLSAGFKYFSSGLNTQFFKEIKQSKSSLYEIELNNNEITSINKLKQ